MDLLASIAALSFAWLLICFVGHGYANTVDHLAYLLHRHALTVRARHQRRTATVNERWVRELESTGVGTPDNPETAIVDIRAFGDSAVTRYR